jgi:hypothetical protein
MSILKLSVNTPSGVIPHVHSHPFKGHSKKSSQKRDHALQVREFFLVPGHKPGLVTQVEAHIRCALIRPNLSATPPKNDRLSWLLTKVPAVRP